MTEAFVLGAGAATAWGFADILVTTYVRRTGFLRTLLVIQSCSLALLTALAVALADLPHLTASQWASVVALGPLAVLAYAGFYRALELGPISIVSPIASANGALLVLLAVLVLGETVTAMQGIACALVVAFVALASSEPAAARVSAGSGIRLALVTCVAFAGYLLALARLAEELGWLMPILLTRAVAVAFLVALTAAGDERARRPLGPVGLLGCGAAGSLDALAFLAFNRGAELGEVAITGAASAAYPLIPIAWGVLALKERVAPRQLVGVGGVLLGMALLAMA